MKARDNPFAIHRLQQTPYHLADTTWCDLLDKLESFNNRAAVIGQHGSGKTTLLNKLYSRFKAMGRCPVTAFANEDTPLTWRQLKQTLTANPDRQILLLDGACHLGRLTWYRLKRYTHKRQIGLIITTHNPGLLPTAYHCRTDITLLQNILKELLPPHEIPNETSLEKLYQQHNQNIREVLRTLYDQWAYQKK
ncbi:MAG: hypothetical protein K9M57_01335 [Phycisphaerae bacterium]|nr:hypothetical protein [Phycisphaerae bacterium]